MDDSSREVDARTSELLDDGVLPDFPPDTPTGVEEFGVTAAEGRASETLGERQAREVPDFPDRGTRSVEGNIGTLVDPDEGVGIDVTAEAVASEVMGGDELVNGDASPEELAMHITKDPPLGDGDDGYV